MDEKPGIDLLAVGAHPDDVEIAVGGTLIKLVKRGRSVRICDLTDGEPTPLGDAEIRRKEAARSAEIIGVERITLDMPNRYLQDTLENRRKLALVIRELRPGLLLAPYPGGEHPDHIAASQIVDGARFYAKLTKTDMYGNPWRGEPWWTPKILYYLGIGAYQEFVRPSFLIDVTHEYEQKMRALACYQSQKLIVARLSQSVDHYGPVIGVERAEAFFSREPLVVGDLLDPTPVVPRRTVLDERSSPGIMQEMEKELIKKILEQVHGNREQAASLLGMGERTLYRKLRRYGLR